MHGGANEIVGAVMSPRTADCTIISIRRTLGHISVYSPWGRNCHSRPLSVIYLETLEIKLLNYVLGGDGRAAGLMGTSDDIHGASSRHV